MKNIKVLFASALLTLSMSAAAFAGSWQTSETGMWYQNDDGTYPVSIWQWIDGDQNGIAERYYFNEAGYLLVNTSAPDGALVNENGAWIADGVVQTLAADQAAAVNQAGVPSAVNQTEGTAAAANTSTASAVGSGRASGSSVVSDVPYDGYTIVVNTNTKKYHRKTCSSVKDINPQNMGYSSD